jgi:Rieske Fe-S protein
VCPWHASRFALEDGRIINGPAVHPQPCLETRIRNGKIEVRKSACDGEEFSTEMAIAPGIAFADQPE